MSVAFRRESDEAHLEPRFELPIPPGPNLVTARGLALIEAQVVELEALMRAAPDPDAAMPIARDLRYWQTRRATAIIAPPPAPDEVSFGSRVRVRIGGEERSFDLVGHDEADTARGEIAFTAPLARALIGAAAGDSVNLPGRSDPIEVLTVEGIPAANP